MTKNEKKKWECPLRTSGGPNKASEIISFNRDNGVVIIAQIYGLKQTINFIITPTQLKLGRFGQQKNQSSTLRERAFREKYNSH